MLESSDIVLFIKHQHRLLIINGIYCSERYGAVAVSYENTIAHYTCRTLISIGKRLYVT